MFRKKPTPAHEKQALGHAIAMKQTQDRQDLLKDKAVRNYLDVYSHHWRQVIWDALESSLSKEEKLRGASGDESAFLLWAKQKLVDETLTPKQLRLIEEPLLELQHIEGLRRELITPQQVADFCQMAALLEEMDLFYNKAEAIYQRLILVIEEKLEEALHQYVEEKAAHILQKKGLSRQELYQLVAHHNKEMGPTLLTEESVHALVQDFYQTIENDVLESSEKIKEAFHEARKKNPAEHVLSEKQRHVPKLRDASRVMHNTERFKQFAEELQYETLRKRIEKRLSELIVR